MKRGVRGKEEKESGEKGERRREHLQQSGKQKALITLWEVLLAHGGGKGSLMAPSKQIINRSDETFD